MKYRGGLHMKYRGGFRRQFSQSVQGCCFFVVKFEPKIMSSVGIKNHIIITNSNFVYVN